MPSPRLSGDGRSVSFVSRPQRLVGPCGRFLCLWLSARRQLRCLRQGSVYPALIRLEQQGWIRTRWGVSVGSTMPTSWRRRRASSWLITTTSPRYVKQKEAPRGELQVVGVIRDERVGGLQDPQSPVVYVPLAQVPRPEVRLIVRTRGEPASAIKDIQEAVRQIAPNLALADVRTMEQVRERSLSGAKQPAWVVGAFAGVAALLAALGLYGVLSHLVTQQRREIGIRMALGARPRDVLALVLVNASSMVGVGLALGLLGALAITKGIRGVLFEVSPLDPAAFAVASASMVLIALGAGLVPAGRATRVAPVDVLRDEG